MKASSIRLKEYARANSKGKFCLFLGGALLALFCTLEPIYAQIPRSINLQGMLSNTTGPLADGDYTVTLRLYDVLTGGSPLYEESQSTHLTNAIFSLQIGSTSPFPVTLKFDKPYYLGIAVQGGSEMTPRTAIVSVPYALRAATSDVASGLAPGATGVVTSVNELTGPVQILGDASITVTPDGSGHSLTLHANGGGTGSINEIKSTDGSITITGSLGPKPDLSLADSAVTSGKIKSGSITTAKIAAGAVTADKLNQSGATQDQILKWNGTKWAAADDANTAYSAGNGISIVNNVITATTALPAATTLNSTMRWNGTNWVESTKLTSDAAGNTAVSGTLSATGNTTLAGTLDVTGAANANGTLTVAGATTLKGATAIGDGTGADNVVIAPGTGTITVTGFPQGIVHSSSTGVLTSSPISAATDLSGVLPVANGGTGSSTALTNNKLLVSSGGAIVEAPALTDGKVFIGSTGSAPQAATLTAGSGVTITNGPGSITIAAPNTLPTGTALHSTMRWNGTSWVENTFLTADATGKLISTGLSSSGGLNLTGTSSPLMINGSGGTAGQILVSTGTSSTPQWTSATGLSLPFSQIGTGTNTTAAMTVGSGASIVAGGGIVEATKFKNAASTTDAVDLATNEVGGLLPIANGGTNSSAALSNNRVMLSSSGAIVEAPAMTSGQLLIGSTGAAPQVASLIAGSGVTITPGAGSITIAATGGLPTGTTNNSTLRYNSATSTWQENTGLQSSLTGNTTVSGTLGVSGATTLSNLGAGIVHASAAGLLSSSAVDLASDVTGLLPVAKGGTNSSTTLNNNRLMVSSSGAIVEAAAGTGGQMLVSGGSGVMPSWTSSFPSGISVPFNQISTGSNSTATMTLASGGSIVAGGGVVEATKFKNAASTSDNVDLATSEVSGTLPVANGGTNSSTALNNKRLMLSSAGAIVEAPAMTDGQLMIGSTGNAPQAATLTAGSGISITPAAGAITIAATSLMPSGTTNNSTLRYDLATTSWVENTGLRSTSTGNTSISGTLNVTSTSLLTGAVTTGGSLSVGGAISGTSTLSVSGATTLSNLAGASPGIVHASTTGLLSSSPLDLTADLGNTVLPIANGGTASGAALNNNRAMVSSGGAIVESAAPAAANYVLTSQTNAPPIWTDPNTLVTAGWKLTGNAGTSAASNFVGTTDVVDFRVAANNTEAFRIGSATAGTATLGNFSFGSTTLTAGRFRVFSNLLNGASTIYLTGNRIEAVDNFNFAGTGNQFFGTYVPLTMINSTAMANNWTSLRVEANIQAAGAATVLVSGIEGLIVAKNTASVTNGTGIGVLGSAQVTTAGVTLTNAYALRGDISVTNATGVITNGMGLYLNTPTTTGTLTNYTAAYLQNIPSGGTSRRAFWYDATGANKPFTILNTGFTGVGTSAPTEAFEVKDGNLLLSNSSSAGMLKFAEPSAGGTNFSAFKAQAQTSDITYILPAALPASNGTLTSDASGNLSWSTGGAVTFDQVGSGTNTTATMTVGSGASIIPHATTPGIIRANQYSGTLPIANGGTNSTATPTAGGIVYGDGSQHLFTAAGTSGYFLTSAGAGAPTWTSPNGIGWSLSGNSGTTPGTGANQNYLGTTDLKDLVIATNATEQMRFASNGNTYIGYTGTANPAKFGVYATLPGGSSSQLDGVFMQTDLPATATVPNASSTGFFAPSLLYNNASMTQPFSGIEGQVFLNGAATSTIRAITGVVRNVSNAANSNAVGVYGSVRNESTASGSTSITSAAGFRSNMVLSSSIGSVTNGYGLFVENPVLTAGSITNFTGLYVQDITAGTNKKAFFYDGQSSNKPVTILSTGSTGIGTSSPGELLEVKDGNLLLSNSGAAGMLKFAEPSASGSNFSAFKAQAQGGDITYTLPASLPGSSGVLTSDNLGALTWGSAGSTLPSGTTNNSTLRYSTGGTPGWLENTQFLVTGGGDITANGVTVLKGPVTLGDGTGQDDVTITAGSGSFKVTNFNSIGVLQSANTGVISSTNLNLATGPLTGILQIGKGGTGLSSVTGNGVLITDATPAIAEVSLAANGKLLIGSATGAPAGATLTAGTGISITNGANSITVGMSGTVGVTGDLTIQENTYGTDLNGTTNNLNLGTGKAFVSLTSASGAGTITGLANGSDGRVLIVLNTTGQTMTFKHENAGSSAGNRLWLRGQSDKVIVDKETISFIYSANSSRWVQTN